MDQVSDGEETAATLRTEVPAPHSNPKPFTSHFARRSCLSILYLLKEELKISFQESKALKGAFPIREVRVCEERCD